MPIPTWRLAIAAAMGAVVVLLAPVDPWVSLATVNGLLVVLALLDWWRAPRPEQIEVEREVPGVVGLDAPAAVRWRVRNSTPPPVRLRLCDELGPSLRPESRRATLRVPGGGRATAGTTIRPSRRGRYTPTELTVRVDGPWGLAARQKRRQVPGVIRVYPPFHSRDEAELRINRARVLEVGLRSAQGRGGGTEFDSLREYSEDDEFRRIDWAATARLNKPIVRTYRAERNQTVLILLDSGRVMAGLVESYRRSVPAGRVIGPVSSSHRQRAPDGRSAGTPMAVPRLDHAMDAVMMLTAVSTRLGDRAGFIAFADEVRCVVPPSHTRGQLARVTESLYDLEPRLVESDYRGAFTESITRFRRRALMVVLTELTPAAAEETLLPALPVVVRDHLLVIAAVRDPAVDRWATAVPTDAQATYRKTAAIQSLAERRLLIARLRGLGATVIDAVPGRLAPELADAYLKVKAVGRL